MCIRDSWCAIADLRYTFTCEILSRSVYSVVLCLRKTPIFAVFGLRHSGVTTWQQSEKVEHGYTTIQTFPYPTVSKSFLYSNAFMAKSGAQTLTFKSVTNRQTNRQKNSTFLAAHMAGSVIFARWRQIQCAPHQVCAPLGPPTSSNGTASQ